MVTLTDYGTRFHHMGVCIAFESERVYKRGGGVVFVPEREVDAKAFNTCKGVVIIIGEAGVLWSVYCMASPIQTCAHMYIRMLAFLRPPTLPHPICKQDNIIG
jgi:predicted small integral membrane protein